MSLELELLLRTGRVKEVREWADVEHQETLGPKYHWLRAQALVASGDYAPAQEECRLLADEGWRSGGDARTVMAALLGQAVLDANPGTGGLDWLLGRARPRAEFSRQVAELTAEVQQAADATVLRGLIALEAGEVESAAAAFRRALQTWKDEVAVRSGGALDFSARPVAQECLKWIEAAGPAR